MYIREFEKEVHQNAVEHGWWESNRGIAEIVALIHSEWSEALEEYRANRPMVWYNCNEISVGTNPCELHDETDCLNYGHQDNCMFRSKKPEGIAVELIDGCIRVLDYLGKEDVPIHGMKTFEELMKQVPEATFKVELPQLIANLHLRTSQAYHYIRIAEQREEKGFAPPVCRSFSGRGFEIMFEIIAVAFCWIMDHGYAPMSIMQEKHAYNRTRPYKHGGKTC